MTLEDWLSLASKRFLVVHSCHSGHVSHSFPSDLGGLPGFALSIGCRVALAPVTEVPRSAALRLHREIVAEQNAPEIGLRYLAAIKLDPAVALYNLYGFANEV